ncbi:MAG: hypothetical protein ACRDXX_22130 [Stackebrandtia sp.]
MRTCFDIDERDEYHAARALLVRRCQAWSKERKERLVDEVLLRAALDSRHFSSDGRLTYWTPVQVRRFLLEWAPQRIAGEVEELGQAPEALRVLLRFIDANGLRDPRGASTADNEAAVDAAHDEFLAAVAAEAPEPGFTTQWPTPAYDVGTDVAELLDTLPDIEIDPAIAAEERTLAQLPVRLPSDSALADSADSCLALQRLRRLADWLGAEGKPTAADGWLGAGDAEELADKLGLDEPDTYTGARPGLSPQVAQAKRERLTLLYLAWAKRMRLIRRHRGRLVPVAKTAKLTRDPLALWRRAFDVLADLGEVICRRPDADEDASMAAFVFPELLPDVLNSLYSLPAAMPVRRLDETVWWHCCGAFFEIDELPPAQRERERRMVDVDLARMWDLLTQLGVLEWTTARPDAIFHDDLTPDAVGSSRCPFKPEVAERLAEELDGDCRLLRLTDVATWAMRERMLAEGREAGLVGELADVGAEEMLSVVTQHYPAQTAAEEVAGWMDEHGADVESLLNVARAAPFRCRAAAILDLLHDVQSDSGKLLRRMRSDPALAPSALVSLVETGTLDLMDLTEPERQLLTAESSLRLMELDGPEAVVAGLEELSGAEARTILDKVLTSGHPDVRALEEFRTLVAAPLTHNGAGRRGTPPPPPPTMENGRLGATRRARVQRRGRP